MSLCPNLSKDHFRHCFRNGNHLVHWHLSHTFGLDLEYYCCCCYKRRKSLRTKHQSCDYLVHLGEGEMSYHHLMNQTKVHPCPVKAKAQGEILEIARFVHTQLFRLILVRKSMRLYKYFEQP